MKAFGDIFNRIQIAILFLGIQHLHEQVPSAVESHCDGRIGALGIAERPPRLPRMARELCSWPCDRAVEFFTGLARDSRLVSTTMITPETSVLFIISELMLCMHNTLIEGGRPELAAVLEDALRELGLDPDEDSSQVLRRLEQKMAELKLKLDISDTDIDRVTGVNRKRDDDADGGAGGSGLAAMQWVPPGTMAV